MLYADTSVIVKLYFRETYSREAADRISQYGESIPFTPFHDLEFTNAVNLKLFRKELTQSKANIIFERFSEHEQKGVYYRPPIDWTETMIRSIDLSKRHTSDIGSISLDIMHVALALSIGADRFFTLDGRQSQLALMAGLNVI